MPVTRSQAAMSEAVGESEVEGLDTGGDMSTSYGRGNDNRSFQEELLAIIVEQKDLLAEHKEVQESQMFSIAEKISGELQQLSVEFGQLCNKNKQLENTVGDLQLAVQGLNQEIATSQERLVKIHAGMLSSSQEIVKQEVREEFRASLAKLRKEIKHAFVSREQSKTTHIQAESKTSTTYDLPSPVTSVSVLRQNAQRNLPASTPTHQPLIPAIVNTAGLEPLTVPSIERQ